MKLRSVLTTIMLVFVATASSAITSGYYRIKSNAYEGRCIGENYSSHELFTTTSYSDTDYSLVWYISANGSTVTFKNVLTDRYIQKQSTTSALYSTGTSSVNFTASSSSPYTFANSGSSSGLHCSASQSYNVVLWATSADASKWLIESASVDQTELANQKAALTTATTSQLTQFFTSTACTELKSTYTTYSDTNLRSAMSSLPTTVQDLAVKIKNNSWTTYSGWDKTEKTFRIADYKAYSSYTRWTNIFNLGYSMGRLSNPTGIWANAGEILQVYVGAIPSGQSVKLEVAGYGQAYGTQYSLSQGMNCLKISSAGNCFIYYDVDNTTSGSTPYKLMSNYADVTVHIESGTVQGYFDLTKGDTDSDWDQMKTHLLTDVTNRPAVCLKTDKHVMNLGITRLITALNGSSMTDMLNVWKNLAQWEDELMGRSDGYGGQTTYGQYCNTLFSVTALAGTNGYPHSSNYGTYYYEYSDDKIFNANQLLTVADNMWCIAHEQGHNRQNPINMAGNTEISNNLFSNVAIYYQGRYTSRTASIQETFRDYIDGLSWPERVAKACDGYGNYNQQMLHLNWQLYLYFHVLGKDPDFFPRLFDALRADPMTKVKSGSADNSTLTPASTDYLKYYVKCCQVSGCDLTEFFAAYGFFIIPSERDYSITYNGVTTNRFATLNDYGYYYLYATQSMIDNAKSQVANLNLPKCNIIFIEDRVSAPDATNEGAASGTKKTINPDAPVTAFGEVGEMGQYTDFITNENVTPSACSYNVTERGTVTIEGGEGAVGFIVYDSSGNPIAFANTRTFTLPAGATNYTIKAAAANGTTTVSATYDSNIDIAEDFPRTDKWYTLLSKGQSGRYTQSNGAGSGLTGTTGSTGNIKQWRFQLRTGEAETFDIINRNDGSFISPLATWNTQVSTSTTQPESGWKVEAVGDYYIIYSGGTQLNQTGNSGYPIYNWGGGSNKTDANCLFTISAVADYEGEIVIPEPVTSDVTDVTNIADNATDAITAGDQVTAESSIVSGKAYLLRNTATGNPWISDAGSYYSVPDGGGSLNKSCVYYLIKDGSTWKIENYITEKYWGKPTSASITNQGGFVPTDESGAGSWSLNFNSSNNIDPQCNGFYINRSSQKLHAWSTSLSSQIYEVAFSSAPLSELKNKDINVSSTAASTLETGQWYVMFDRGANHGYLYENSSSHTLYNTSTAPSGYAPDNAKYLVRIVGSNNEYYIQTGFGNFFGQIMGSTAVPTTALKEQLITLKKISNNDGHYYLASSAGVVLDANSLENGDATVVGWGTAAPTSTGGNNDWAFYPVELVESWSPTASDVYTINNTNTNRGALTYEPAKSTTYVWSSGKSGATAFDAENQNHQWVIIPTGTSQQYYLFNIGAGKFAIPTAIAQGAGNPWVFSDNAVAVIFENQGDGTKKIKMATTPVSGTNAAYMAVSNNYNGPIINYNDIGGNFTITKVDGDASAAANAAVAKLVKSQTALTSYPQATGWYVIQIKSKTGSDSYAGRYLQNSTTLFNDLYPLTFTGGVDIQPAITDPTFFTHIDYSSWDSNDWQLPDGRYLVSNSNSKFPTTSSTAGNVICGYNNGNYFKSSANYYADPYNSSANYFIGETSYMRTVYTVYPIDLTTAGLTAWQVICDAAPDNTQITCSRNDVSGLTAVYKNGYFFLPIGVTPEETDFALDGANGVTIDATAHAITFAYDPNLAMVEGSVTVEQGWQTAGRNSEVMLLKVTAAPFKEATGASLTINLKDGSEANISTLTLYEADSNSPEIYSTGSGAPTKTEIATANISGSTATFSIGDLSAGTHYYWIGATVKGDATLGTILDAAVTGITYTCNEIVTNLDLTSVGDPADRGAMVFNVRSYPFLPRDNGSRVYRIPAMVVANDGSIVVACDKRYDSHTDIGGGHVIDIVIRRSTDGGQTWSSPITIAKGDNSNDATCGYGDPSLYKGNDGKLYCVYGAGNTGYFYGLSRVCVSVSTDNGATWNTTNTSPTDLTAQSKLIDHASSYGNNTCYGLFDYFVTSGRGLCTSEGYLMGLLPAQAYTDSGRTNHTSNSQDYIFYSTDQGATWNVSENAIFAGGDEAKIIQANDGSLIASVRQSYNRGFNTATYTKNDDGTLSFTMGTQWNNSQLSAGGYANNQDIFYYQRETVTGKTDVIIHSMTTGQHANLKLYYSTDGGANWTEFLNVQTKGTRYVTLERSGSEENPGSLYLFFEDQSLNSAGGYTDYNHYPLNFLEITREQLLQYIPNLDQSALEENVKIVYGKTAETTYGTLSGNTWTSNETSGVAGLTMTKSDGEFNKFSSWNGHYNLAYKPAAANTPSTLTLTAPIGYVIKSYSLLAAKAYSAAHTYTLTAADGTTITPAFASSESDYTAFDIDDVNATTTTISITTTDASKFIAIADFVVVLVPQTALRGDVNQDGFVTIADVTALVNIILGKSTDEYGVADVNEDGAVTIADVTALVNIILGK